MKQHFHFPLRLLSICLSIVICFGALPFVSSAEDGAGLFFEGESFADSVVVTGGSAAAQDLS